MSLYQAVARFLTARNLRPRHVLAALSGGIDSTALLVAIAEVSPRPFEISALHVNHHLRGEESIEDARFAADLCKRLDVSLTVVDGTLDPDRSRAVGIEAAAREVRYDLFSSEASRLGTDLTFTAHQKNDQAETLLIGLITGRGPWRLKGIAPVRGTVARPLLEVTRSEIVSFLQERGITARRDTSNDDSRFLRNRIRSEVIPLLLDLNPQVIDCLAETARLTREEQELLELWTRERALTAVTRNSEVTTIDAGGDPSLAARLVASELERLNPGGRSHSLETVERILAGGEGSRTSVTHELHASTKNGIIHLTRLQVPPPRFESLVHPGESIRVPEINAQVSVRTVLTSSGELSNRGDRSFSQQFQLPMNGSDTPDLVIRNRRRGDRFRPLGMKNEKKLKDFLIDRKIPRVIRDRIPLLVWNDQLVWVGGIEVSDAFRISDQQGVRMEITLSYDG